MTNSHNYQMDYMQCIICIEYISTQYDLYVYVYYVIQLQCTLYYYIYNIYYILLHPLIEFNLDYIELCDTYLTIHNEASGMCYHRVFCLKSSPYLTY